MLFRFLTPFHRAAYAPTNRLRLDGARRFVLERLEQRLAAVVHAESEEDALFGLPQSAVAVLDETDAAFVAIQRVVQAELAVFQVAHRAFQFDEGVLKREAVRKGFCHGLSPLNDCSFVASRRRFHTAHNAPVADLRDQPVAGPHLLCRAHYRMIRLLQGQAITPPQHLQGTEAFQPRRLGFQLSPSRFHALAHGAMEPIAPIIEPAFLFTDALQWRRETTSAGQRIEAVAGGFHLLHQ